MTAKAYALESVFFQTNDYQLVGFLSSIEEQNYLNVYLEGDGLPWVGGAIEAKDPTGKTPFSLALMSQDSAPSLYLNRPCYALLSMPNNCDSTLWTSHRYSETVVTEMNDALDNVKTRLGIRAFNIIGYSGGGSLAVLIAARRSDVEAVVTIAANLDHKAWTEYFGYDTLHGSHNAVESFPLHETVRRWHLVGEADLNVPPQLILDAAKKDKGATIKTFPGFDHSCCWKNIWGKLIEEMTAQTQP